MGDRTSTGNLAIQRPLCCYTGPILLPGGPVPVQVPVLVEGRDITTPDLYWYRGGPVLVQVPVLIQGRDITTVGLYW